MALLVGGHSTPNTVVLGEGMPSKFSTKYPPTSATIAAACMMKLCAPACSQSMVVPFSITQLHASRRTVIMATFGESRSYAVDV